MSKLMTLTLVEALSMIESIKEKFRVGIYITHEGVAESPIEFRAFECGGYESSCWIDGWTLVVRSPSPELEKALRDHRA